MGTTSREPHQLPPGRHGLPADYVASNQRARILAAVAPVVAASGYGDATVAAIIDHAGVSRRSFYQHFANKQDVFLAAFDDAVQRLTEELVAAYRSGDGYIASVRNCLDRCLAFLSDEPALAVMIIIEVMSAGAEALDRRRRVLAELTEQLARSSCAMPRPPMGPELTAETVIGAVFQVIYNRVQQGDAARLPELLPDLLYSVLAPFVGPERAAAERAATLGE